MKRWTAPWLLSVTLDLGLILLIGLLLLIILLSLTTTISSLPISLPTSDQLWQYLSTTD